LLAILKRSVVKKVLLILIPAFLIVVAGAWFEPTRTVRGWAMGEPFFQGRSASYWEAGLTSTDPKEQDRAERALEDSKADSLPVLIHLLGSPREGVRLDAAALLGSHGPAAADAVPALIARLDDGDLHVRAVSAQSLALIGPKDPRVVTALTAKLTGRDRDYVIRPLSAAGPEARDAVPELTKIAGDGSLLPKTRWEAIRTLQKIGPEAKPAVPALIKALGDENDLVREHAAEALGEIGDPMAAPHLIRVLTDRATMVRRDAVRSLGQLGPAAKDALPAVKKLLEDKEDLVRDAAKTALRRIDPDAR
jgi:HEAT repeat protein